MLPGVARWKVALDKEIESLRVHKVHYLFPVMSIPPRQKVISSSLVYNIKVDT